MAEGESVKMFVGQVPKQMTEVQLLAVFSEFALVDEVKIIRDKETRASRGLIRSSFCMFLLSDRNVLFSKNFVFCIQV